MTIPTPTTGTAQQASWLALDLPEPRPVDELAGALDAAAASVKAVTRAVGLTWTVIALHDEVREMLWQAETLTTEQREVAMELRNKGADLAFAVACVSTSREP